jgi:hypothetical protein
MSNSTGRSPYQPAHDYLDEPHAEASERRRRQRIATTWSATIHFGPQAIDGVIANISASGALIVAKHDIAIDTLIVLRVEQFGYLPARVVWRSDDRIGVQFLDTPQRTAQLLGLNELVRQSGDVDFIPF